MRITIVSGLSGSGKSVALHTLEDEGFYCIDNLPGSLLDALIEKLARPSSHKYEMVAIGIDARSDNDSMGEFLTTLDKIKTRQDLEIEILFLETNRETLLKRFSETRRKHPLSDKGTPLVKAIEMEADFLLTMKERADLVIDTSRLNLHQLRETVLSRMVNRKPESLAVLFQSFGFKYGSPASSDFVFDVRCLPNPYWDTALRHYSGLDQPVRDFLEQHDEVEQMYSQIQTFFDYWMPVFAKENRSYLSISIGCTGGRHRSVYLASRLAEHFGKQIDNVTTRHREMT